MPYIIFEGPDGVGKSTAIDTVIEKLTRDRNTPHKTIVKLTMPGSTKLGKHLRQLVKTPETISPDISINDPVTRQLLYAADYSDTMNLVKTHLHHRPETLIMTDRCSAISSRVYGGADGADVRLLGDIYDAIPAPIAEIMFILLADPSTTAKRMNDRPEDYFDQKDQEFKTKIYTSYKIITEEDPFEAIKAIQTSNDAAIHYSTRRIAKHIIGIDATQPPDAVASDIVNHIQTYTIK